jgi:hypothetical protein
MTTRATDWDRVFLGLKIEEGFFGYEPQNAGSPLRMTISAMLLQL